MDKYYVIYKSDISNHRNIVPKSLQETALEPRIQQVLGGLMNKIFSPAMNIELFRDGDAEVAIALAETMPNGIELKFRRDFSRYFDIKILKIERRHYFLLQEKWPNDEIINLANIKNKQEEE